MNGLDPQTRELLERVPPERCAPAKTSEFGLVLVGKGSSDRRLVRAILRINRCDENTAAALAQRPAPLFVNLDLDYGDAILGQFELVCCDAPAAILPSSVLERGDPRYLAELFADIAVSEEFRPTKVAIHELPADKEGTRFGDQFLGVKSSDFASISFPLTFVASFKKVRMWAERIGGRVELG